MGNTLISAFVGLFVQIIFTAGLIGLFGMFISFCNRCFCDCVGGVAFFIVRITGFIGTPIHELSHALMCLIFGHKITKMQIYNIKMSSGTLGYVEHTYNRKNLYNQMGNFFIGVAPIVIGGLAVTLFVRFLTPQMYATMIFEGTDIINVSFDNFFFEIPKSIWTILSSIFSPSNFSNWRWWVCIIFAIAISIHMEISRSDIKGGLKGLAIIAVLLLVTDLILAFLFPRALTAVTSAMISAGTYIATFLMIPAAFSGMLLIISGLVALIKALIRSIANGAE